MLIFREAKKADLKSVADIYTESFLDYDFFKIIEPNTEKLEPFVRSIQTLGLKSDLRRHQVFVGEDEGQIVVAMSVQLPKVEQPSILEFICDGALVSCFHCGFKKIIGWLNMYKECDKPLEVLPKPMYYLETLAVKKESQGKGYGGKALHDFLIPFVQKRGCGTISFITNSESNVRFYEKNGFTCFYEGMYEKQNIHIKNWCFRYDVTQ